ILLTLSNPPISLPPVLKLTDSFGSLSRYKINWSKSEVMPLNPHTFQADLVDSPFVWKTSGMKYLGINIVFPITKIFSLNGPRLIQFCPTFFMLNFQGVPFFLNLTRQVS
uniref:Uncharacterized protein n=1 Tax=Salmo trutta TaxID=8032 RepID=A0A673WEW2_SALTR